eukprot:g15143.t1
MIGTNDVRDKNGSYLLENLQKMKHGVTLTFEKLITRTNKLRKQCVDNKSNCKVNSSNMDSNRANERKKRNLKLIAQNLRFKTILQRRNIFKVSFLQSEIGPGSSLGIEFASRKNNGGVIVKMVKSNSIAERKGVKRSMVLSKINGVCVLQESLLYVMMCIKISLSERRHTTMSFKRFDSIGHYAYKRTLKNILTEEAGKIVKVKFKNIKESLGIELIPTKDMHWLMIKSVVRNSYAHRQYGTVLKRGMTLRTLNGEGCKYLSLSDIQNRLTKIKIADKGFFMSFQKVFPLGLHADKPALKRLGRLMEPSYVELDFDGSNNIGIVLIGRKKGGAMIQGVKEGSEAEQKYGKVIKKGMTLTNVDGEDVASYTLESIIALISKKKKKEIIPTDEYSAILSIIFID